MILSLWSNSKVIRQNQHVYIFWDNFKGFFANKLSNKYFSFTISIGEKILHCIKKISHSAFESYLPFSFYMILLWLLHFFLHSYFSLSFFFLTKYYLVPSPDGPRRTQNWRHCFILIRNRKGETECIIYLALTRIGRPVIELWLVWSALAIAYSTT